MRLYFPPSFQPLRMIDKVPLWISKCLSPSFQVGPTSLCCPWGEPPHSVKAPLVLLIDFKMPLSGFKREGGGSTSSACPQTSITCRLRRCDCRLPNPTRWFFSTTIRAQWAIQSWWIPYQLNILCNFSENMILSENKCNSLELIFPLCLTFSFL